LLHSAEIEQENYFEKMILPFENRKLAFDHKRMMPVMGVSGKLLMLLHQIFFDLGHSTKTSN